MAITLIIFIDATVIGAAIADKDVKSKTVFRRHLFNMIAS